MENSVNIQIKVWHMLTMLFLFMVFTNILGAKDTKGSSLNEVDNCLVELNQDNLLDSITKRLCFVLFYVEGSPYCDVMLSNLNKLAKDYKVSVGFYKLDLSKLSNYKLSSNISGVPSISILNDGVEVGRIVGVVPEHNLRRIYNKSMK